MEIDGNENGEYYYTVYLPYFQAGVSSHPSALITTQARKLIF